MQSAEARSTGATVRWILAGASTFAAACGGGGGGGGSAPPATLSFNAAGATVAEGAGALDVQVVLHTTQAATAQPASVTVGDRGTGSAVSGSDYAAFAPQVVSFPAGSLDGDVRSVTLTR